MKIIVATIGSRGDVQPYIVLGEGLRDAGHDVTLATNPTLCPLVEQHGLQAAPVGHPVDMGVEGARLMARSFGNMWLGMIRVMQLAGRLVQDAYSDVLALCMTADLVVTSDTGSGVVEAEKLNKPWISVTLQPARVPTLPAGPPTVIERLFGWTLGRLFVGPTNRFRKRVNAPLVKDITTMLSPRLILLPVSHHVAPANPRWLPQVHQTNYWCARPPPGWAPPPALLDFLLAGDRPVAVSLGVMGATKGRQSAQMVLEALRRTGARAIVQGWGDILETLVVPPTVYSAGSLPHAWLFDQVTAVIHHGGFGTTAAGLCAGVPSIVIPHIIDQYYWGQRVFEMGVGPRYFSRGHMTVDKLARSIEQAISDVSMRAKSGALGAAIRADEDGVSEAVRLVEAL